MNNYKNTRRLCKDLSTIVNLPARTTYNFCKLISNAMIHSLAEDALSSDSGKLKEFILELPCVCTLKIRLSNNSLVVDNIQFIDTFEEDALKAINSGDSPLVADAEKSLVESFKNRYNSLI